MALRAVLFDKDGTLIDFDRTWYPVMARLAAEAAPDDPGRAAHLLQLGGLDPQTGRFRAGSVIAAGTIDETVDLWYPALRGRERRAMIDRFNHACATEGAARAVAIPDLAETLDRLAGAGYALGVATNDGHASAVATLDRLGVLDRFGLVMGYDSVTCPKPAPDQLHRFAAHAGVAAAEVVMIGDNVHDLQMARAGGAGLAVGVLSGTGARSDLEALADMVIGSVAELPRILEDLGRT